MLVKVVMEVMFDDAREPMSGDDQWVIEDQGMTLREFTSLGPWRWDWFQAAEVLTW